MAQKRHVAILPSPGMGHIIPLVEIAKKLLLNHDLSSTIIIPSSGEPLRAQKLILQSLPEEINHVFLPPISLDDLKTAGPETRVCLTITRSLPSFRNVIASLVNTANLVALIVDYFGTDVFDVAMEFNVPSYVFCLSNCLALSLLFYLPTLDETVTCDYRDMTEPIQLPGWRVQVHGRDLPDPLQDRKNDAYKSVIHQFKRVSLAEGILLNSFMDLEVDTIKALQETKPGKIYPVGPIIQSYGSINYEAANVSNCLKWLDYQPRGSVLFVCFGSGGTLSFDQLRELALGLEISKQKFLMVVRNPDNNAANGAYFNAQSNGDPFGFLPEGFMERTKGQGLVVSSWAPQIEVLGHGSTGGFLTHCGWSSALESIVHGVPLIAWPLYAEQSLNAVLLTEDLKVALRPKRNENGIVGREEIARVVKGLMQGEEGVAIRGRMHRLKEAAANAVSDNGSSTVSLSELAFKWKNKKCNTKSS